MPIDTDLLCRSVVKLRSVVPEDAFTAEILGLERVGNGIVVEPGGLILTIGYLITEASDVWLTVDAGPEIPAHALAYDQVTGFGLVAPLGRVAVPPLRLGSSAALRAGDTVYVVCYSGFAKPQVVEIVAKREFTGAWEYLLETALFTAPASPHWSGAALLDADGALIGVGSLLVREVIRGEETNANMFVPIDLLKPILHDLVTLGRTQRPSRPWLGLYTVEVTGKIYVTGVADGSPAQTAGILEGDMVSHVAEHPVRTLADFYRCVWSLGTAGTQISLTTVRGGNDAQVIVRSVDRNELLKRPPAH